MFGWSPPNILATLVLCLSLLLLFDRTPTQAKPYRKQDILSTYTAGNLGGFNERDWPELINYKNGHYIERDKRSPTEFEDESPNGNEGEPRKRQGIETPIQPLTSDSGLDKDTFPHLNSEENVRSKVDQPDSKQIGVPVEEEKKAVEDTATDSSTTQHRQDSTDNAKSNTLKSEESNEGQEKEHASLSNKNVNGVQTQQGETDQLKTEENRGNDKADSSSETLNNNQSTENKISASVGESKTESSRPVDENAQVRSVQENNNGIRKLGNVPSDKNAVRFPGSSPSLENNQSNPLIDDVKANRQEAQASITNNVNKQVNTDETKITTAKVETPVTTTTSRDQNAAAPAENNAVGSSAETQSSPQESATIHTVPQMQNVPVGPVRDALGNSGSEIVTTRGASDLDSYTERDTEPKPSNGPEVGHFQVDDKSADLEINANSAGVKVKAKPASLQVVSRPGSHSPTGAAQERSLYHHYHYPPYHPHHHWFPGMRRSYGHFHRRHFFHPYHSFPERRGFDSFYDEAPFYRRHMRYWYPHRHRHHFHDSDLYERSRMEEPDNYPIYHGRRRHKRRFRHMNGPYKRQFYNNIPIMNGMESPQMGMTPEEGTMPQLPIGGGIPFTQRQNIMTPMPPPINVAGNPPPGLLGGINAANFAMNGMPRLNNFNQANQMNNLNAFNGISGINGMNNIGAMGLNSLGQMGNIEGLPGEINNGMESMGGMENGGVIPGATRALDTSNIKPPSEAPRMAFKKTAILSSAKSKSETKELSHDQKMDPKRNASHANFEKDHSTEKKNKGKVNIKSWEKTLKRYHRLNVFTSKAHERHQYRRNAKSSEKLETKKKDEQIKRKHGVSHLHAQHAKDVKGNRKNAIVMHRPPIIYHPPPEIYHRPDIVVHRAPIMLHRPPIIYHQPPVVVHRPAIIYHQPPIVFHQPPPVVHQPILHSHDTWVTKPMVYHTASMVSHAKTYYGIPSHVYSGDYGEGCHGAHCSYRKERVPHSNSSQAKNITHAAEHKRKTKRHSFGDYMAYFTSLWKPKGFTKREIDDEWDYITSTEGTKEKLTFRNTNGGAFNKRDTNTEYNNWNSKVKRETEKEGPEDTKDGTQKKKKKDVVVNRPPIIYHPPPEIYHRPDIVVHRPPLVIHRPPIIYHQPPVIVHRPAVVYHQPPIVFHQPPPAVSQPLLYSHDSFTVHPSFYATHHGSVVRDFGHYVGVPNVITNYGNPLFGRGPPIGKRSKIESAPSTENASKTNHDNSTATASKRASLQDHDNKVKNESSEKAGKKNTVVVSRPPIIYHPPPEIYHRPIIVVHRPPIMIHRAPIFYHQPPVVVHRPAIVYHQPPLVFHQPPPMVHQPVLKSHDTWISHSMVVPYSSRVMHHHTYVGVPDAYTVHHFGGHGNAFYKSHILKHTKSFAEKASERNTITGQNNSTKSERDSTAQDTKQSIASKLKTKKVGSQKGGKKNAVIVRRPPVIYHPPPEIYHRPEIVVHRAPIVIHRAPIIYHQPPVIVHRPAVVYHQPAIIFHQPPPVIHQPLYRSHDTYVRRPVVRLYGSRMHHAGHFYHIPHAYFHGHGGIHYMAYGKSKVPQKENIVEEKGDQRAIVKSTKVNRKSRTGKSSKKARHTRRKHIALTRSKDKTETGIKLHKNHDHPLKHNITYHKAKEVTEKANKKNSVVIHRPPIIYHPPPEIYHRPDIVVHRAPIVLYRAPIIYHQPPVVVHRPAIVYHQPPIVFHQPPPMVHQPVLHSHDTWVTKPVVIPYASHVRHVATYKGVPHEEIFMHGIGIGAFGKSHVPVRGNRRNKIDGVEEKKQTSDEDTKTATEFKKPNDQAKSPKTQGADDAKQRRASNAKLGAGERITRALADFLVEKQWDFEENRKPVGAGQRIQRSLANSLPLFGNQVASTYSSELHLNPQGYDDIPEKAVGAATRIQRSIDGSYIKSQNDAVTTPVGASARIQRAIADPWTSFEDKKSKKDSREASHKRKRKDAHKKKKDVVVNRPPIIYHPPPEVYHRPDIVVHRAPILIHRPPIVYHQPPVVVHRPAVVYHQPPIVFHQPAPAVNQPLLFSHDSFVVHPMAFASHMGSVVNDAGHYVGLPHGGVTNFPGSILHGSPGHVFPALNQPSWARRTEVLKPQSEKHARVDSGKHKTHQKRLSERKDSHNGSDVKKNVKPTVQKSRHTKGERKNKVIVARPPMIYHPPPEIYDRPDIIVHRPDIVIHRPSIVYHQSSVVVHRAPVVYQQPPVVFHQPAPMVSQPVYHAHDTYVAHPVFHPHVSHIAHSATYVGAPHYYPGQNDYGWGLSAHVPTAQTPQYDYTTNYGYSNYQGYTPSPAYGYSLYGSAFGRSKVENSKNKKSKKKEKTKDEEIHNNDSTLNKDNTKRTRRSAVLTKRHFHHHHHHHHHHRHGHHLRGSKRFYHLRPISSFAHRGHRKHVVIIHRPPLIYHPPPQVYRQPDILMHLPPLVYHRPAIMFQQPPTIVHHPSIIYHQPPVVFHNTPPIIHSPIIHSHDIITPHLRHIMVPTSSYVHPAGNYFGPVVPGQAYGKSHIERTVTEEDFPKSKSVNDSGRKGEDHKAKVDEKRETSSIPETKKDNKVSKKQNVDLVVHQPPIVYHPPPDIFDKPAVVMHPPPMVVHRPPILIHRAPVVVHRPPVIIHRPPIVLHHPTPVYHVAHGHYFHPMTYAMGRSTIENESPEISIKDKHSEEKHKHGKSAKNVSRGTSRTTKGERKNLVVVHRPPMIYHPPPEIYDRPDVIVHRPDIVVHRPSVVYHQPSVVIHRPPIIYHQPPVVFHQPSPMVHQPVLHAHDTYLAYPVPVPYTSQVHHAATYVGAPHFFHQPQFGGYVGHAFGKSDVEKVKSKTVSEDDENQSKKETRSGDKTHERSTRDVERERKPNETSRGHKKNKVIIARPPMIYHPPPEIYDRPNIVVHRPDIVIHRPSIVYHQPSVVVHRPPIIYQQPPVVFHQPAPLVHQPIMHAHDTYVAHPVPVPYSSHIQHTSTYVGSPHYFPGGWNYGWSQSHSFGPAYGKSKVPSKNSKSTKHDNVKSEHKEKARRAAKDNQGKNDKEAKPKTTEKSKKKNQVVIHRPPLIYHPPAEVYHKPDVIMHRPDIVIHRPSVVYHQPSVVVHRPPVIYQQPPVVFHQPSPMVRQPVLHAHDTYLAHPYFTPYSSNVYNGGHYVGAPNFYDNGWRWRGHGYGFGQAFGKSEVEKSHKKQKSHVQKGKEQLKGSRRTLEKEEKNMEDEMRLKNETKATTKGNKKNLVIMRRPPLIYHPPPEVYHKPDIIVHRPDIVVHRPSIVFHQPSVVVHRPAVIYHQPPVVFHQPSPMVHQPILHSHDTYFAHPHFVPFSSHLHHTESYVGAPHFYPGNWGWGDHGYGGFHHAFGKSKVEKVSKHHRKSNTEKEKDSEGKRRTLQSTKGIKDNGKSDRKKDASKGHKKNLVVMHRPPLIYHPPPEIYHKPDIIVHRPDLVIHRPSVVFHQPSVVVHRPPVIYHQPPVVFHQPSPMVHQPIFHSHETYFAHPHFVPYLSHLTHAGSYVGAPHFYPGHWGPTHGFGHFMGHAFDKSKVEKGSKKEKLETIKKGENATASKRSEEVSRGKTRRDTAETGTYQKTKMLKHIFTGVKKREHNKNISEKAVPLHPQKEDKKRHKKGHKKNMVIIQRPNLIYHPPAEIYDRPSIIVHRPDFVIHQPSVVYHQPSVVVHRPPIVYNPPPIVFHQPAPMVHQPMYTAHDMYHSHPHFIPYASRISHAHTYVGAPHYYAGGWRYGYGFSDNSLAQRSGWNRWNGYRVPWFPSSSYRNNYFAPTPIASRRVMRGPYSLAFSKSLVQKHVEKPEDSNKVHENHNKQKHGTQSHRPVRKGERTPRSAESRTSVKSRLHKKGHHNGEGDKKNLVIMRRPPLIYHPPPEVYHKPDVIMHRPDIVIHQPSVVYHQPPVMVHRPPIIYKQPPVVFHQPAPMVNQPIFHAHESYMAHPTFVPYASHIQHTGTYLGAPQFFHGGWNYGYSHAFGKSHVFRHNAKSRQHHKKSEKKTKIESTKGNNLHPQEEKDEKASRKNDIVVSRPPIIYHPPPEIYHRPDIVVHRAPIVLHRPPIIYHQPPVVVHRPAVVYHQPPVVFHQPPPTVNQPILHSHDSFVVRPAARFLPQGSTVTHSASYVGIPNHVIHGDVLDFHHFHRSQIEHSGERRSFQKPLRVKIEKSTISKTPTTNKENTETTITDQTQKKTLRSTIHHNKLSKRQLMGSHSLYGPVSPINNIQDLHKSIEQKEKLSIIPGKASNRENEVAKRSVESGYDITKRQIIVPESTENVYRNILPSVYNALGAPTFQDQAIAASDDLPHSDGIGIEHLPGYASGLHNIQELAGAGISRSSFPLSLEQYLPTTQKEESPDVRVHVETTKSSIPLTKREKRQIFPIYQQQGPSPVPRVLFRPPNLGDLGVIHAAAPSSVYNLLSQYHPAYPPITDPLHYLQMATQLQRRPHVNINVQSARSTIPDMEHVLEKRSKEPKSKRQLLAVVPPISAGIPFGGLHGLEGARMMHNFPPYSPYSPLARFLFPPLPHLSYPDESEPEETTYPEALPLFHQPAQHIHNVFSALPEDESNEPPTFNPWASYLSSLYNSLLGYPPYQSHHKPRVHVEVQASKSHIPKATKTENKQDVHSHAHISKRQLYNYLPESSLTNHYALPTTVNYGVPGFPFHRNSPHININVETAKKNGIPSVIKERRSPKGGYIKHRVETKTGDKRDELVEGGENGQEITPNQGNSNFANAPENQFVATSEAAQGEDGTTSNNNQQLQGQEEVSQQQPYQQMVGQRQELEQNYQDQEQNQEQSQQLLPSQGQPMMVPFQAQQLAFAGRIAPLQIPLQQPMQSNFQLPLQAPFVVPFQGVLPSTLSGTSSTPVSEQSNTQQATQNEEEQPKHTSINVNVAAKSTVPTKASKKRKNTLHKRQFVASTQGLTPTYGIPILYNGAAPIPRKPRVSINVQTTKKSAVENDHNKRQSISLLTRFPAMQVLPQTFKQNGVLMPAFNTLPINHKIKANGMLLEELQRQRKHKIPKMAKSKTGSKKQTGLKGESSKMSNVEGKQKENAKKRQFYAVPQSPLAIQQYPEASQLNVHPRPHVSVNVEVNRRKSGFPQRKHHGLLQFKDPKSRFQSFDEEVNRRGKSKSKRQVYGMEQLPHMIHLPVVSGPLLSHNPLKNQRPRVSVNVEIAKKKNKLLGQKELNKESTKKDRRQIYGLSELPHEGLPFPVVNQGQALGYLPSTAHTPHISVNVEASKRSDEEGLHETIHKRQVLQVPFAQPFKQTQEPFATMNNEQSLQSDEQAQGGLTQSPIHVQEEPQQDQSSSTALPSNPAVVQQQQGEDLSSDEAPSQAGLSDTDYQRPYVSVHVEASKRSKDKGKERTTKNIKVKHTMDAEFEKRQLHQTEQEPEDYEPDANEQETVSNAEDLLQDQRPRVSVKVDVAKKKHHVAAIEKVRNPVKRQFTIPFNGALNAGGPVQNDQFMTEKNQEDNEQGVQQDAMLQQAEVQEQQQQQPQPQQVMQPAAFLQPILQQQQIQPFQPVMLPLAHTAEAKTQPKVSISVQTAKSLISTNNDRVKSLSHHKERVPERKSRRQLFGTVPLLSPLGQTTVPEGARRENGRSTVPQSTKAQSTIESHIQGGRKDRRSWKRQLYNYLGGQQEQQILPTQPLQSITEPQQQVATVQPVQAIEQDAGVQLTPVNLPQASLLQTNEQEAPQQYLTQTVVPENNQQASVSPIQSQESTVSPLGTFQRPHVSINVQTAKSHVPNPTRTFKDHKLENKTLRSKLTTGKGRETKKFKRQFDLLGGGVIERRRGPKFVGGALKKPRAENLFGLGNNLNKPVEVFSDPISNLVAGGAAGRKRPKLGGIRLDSPTGVGALPLKGASNPLEGALSADLGAPALLQDNPAETAAPLAQEPGVSTEALFRPTSGMAGPQIESVERESAANVPLSDLPPTGPAVFPLPSINRAFLPNVPVPGAPLPQANPLLLAPRIFPILPLAPPMAVPPMAVPPMEEPPPLQETAPEPPQAPPQLPPMFPPVIPIPVPNTVPAPALPNSESLFSATEEDKPSVHVNVETSRSNVPEREHHSTKHANGPANRG